MNLRQATISWANVLLFYGSFQPKRKRYTYNQVRGIVQASDTELDDGLKIARVVTMDGSVSVSFRLLVLLRHLALWLGTLRHLPLATLSELLQKILVLIVSSSYKASSIPLDQLSQELYDEHAIRPELTEQVVRWFGTISEVAHESTWNANIVAIVRQIGLELLSYHKVFFHVF